MQRKLPNMYLHNSPHCACVAIHAIGNILANVMQRRPQAEGLRRSLHYTVQTGFRGILSQGLNLSKTSLLLCIMIPPMVLFRLLLAQFASEYVVVSPCNPGSQTCIVCAFFIRGSALLPSSSSNIEESACTLLYNTASPQTGEWKLICAQSN